MPLVNNRKLIGVRRVLVLSAFMLVGFSFMRFESLLILSVGLPLVALIYTDLCHRCGAVLFFQRGRTWRGWVDPLYVPQTCSRCGSEI